MQFHAISRPAGAAAVAGGPSGSREGPAEGSLPIPERRALIEILRGATSTPERCWFCMWEGWGDLDACGVEERVELPQRRYFLCGGAVEMALAFPPKVIRAGLWAFRVGTPEADYPRLQAETLERMKSAPRFADQCPSLWWPDDRAWMVATDVDHAWTYVGGSAALIEALLGDDRLEALPARLTDGFFRDSDTVNGLNRE
jgi:hypothetical protein